MMDAQFESAERSSARALAALTTTRFLPLRSSEWLLAAFFLHAMFLALWRSHDLSIHSAIGLIILLVLMAVARADAASSRRVWSIVRDWIPAVLMLVAYWSIDWSAAPHVDRGLEAALIGWDRALLNDWGLRAAIERFGVVVPTVLELAYLLLYGALPAITVGFYVCRRRKRLEHFLFPFLLGSLMTYALLPYFPSQAPRFLYSPEDLPHVNTLLRQINIWILDRCDIRSSIFPSGHVAVGFSTAFAMRLAVPENNRLAWGLLALAVLVWISTIYGRYHYAADGLAGLIVSAVSVGAMAVLRARTIRQRA